MSDSRPHSESPPSNSELAERVARVETKQDYNTEILERVEEAVTDDVNDVAAAVNDLETRQSRMWTAYRAAKWTVGFAASSGAVMWVVQAL